MDWLSPFSKAFFCCSLSILLFLSIFSQISHANELRILTVNEPPANYLDKDGEMQGYVLDIVHALQKELGIKTNIEVIPEARALNIANSTANTLLFSFSKTPYRQDHFHWIGQVLSKKWQVYALKESKISITNDEQLRKINILGVVRGDVREEWLVNHKFTNLHSVTHHEQNVKRLLMGRVPAIVYENAGLIHLCKKLNVEPSLVEAIYTLKIAPVYIMMSAKTAPHIVEKWQTAFQQLLMNGEIEAISKTWQIKLKSDFNIESELANDILIF